jgi:chemotaxis protein CheZ
VQHQTTVADRADDLNIVMQNDPVGQEADDDANDVFARVGRLTRSLHESLRELGYDKVIEKAAAAIPDTRDRLGYVVTMTEQAAERTFNAIDVAKPIQSQLSDDATGLSQQWDHLFACQLSITEFKTLVAETRSFLERVPQQTAIANAQLTEIMMAQDFQDLTGQVIKKTVEIVQTVEGELLRLLLDSHPRERRDDAAEGLMNGPLIKADGRDDVVTNQAQVDDLLEQLGF